MGRPEQAYFTLERSKTRALTEQMLRQQVVPAGANVPTALRDEYQKLRDAVNSLEWQLTSNAFSRTEEHASLLKKLKVTQREFNNSLANITKLDPALGELLQPKPLTRRKYTPLLDLNELVIAFEQGPNELRLYAITKRGGVQTPLAVGIRRQQLEEEVSLFNDGIKTEERDKDKLKEIICNAIDKLCGWLSASLAYPIQQLLANQSQPIKQVTLVPHQLWHLLPTHLLCIEEDYLAFRYEIRYLPSLQVLRLISNREPATEGNGCIIADPRRDDSLKDRETQKEGQKIQELRAQYNFQDQLLTSEEATLTAVRTSLIQAKHVHFACHGKFKEHLQASLLLAHEDELTAMELFVSLRLPNPRLVVLGACETAQIQSGVADEYMGLSSGFLFAGAHNVLAPLWRVDSVASRIFMKDFYELLHRDKSVPASALQQSQRKMQQTLNHKHPYYWGAFVLIGEGR